MLVCSVMATFALLPPPAGGGRAGAQDQAPHVLYASARRGSADGDGSEERPLRSLTGALERARALDGVGRVELDLGEYSADTGEAFPIRVPAGWRLRGLTSAETRIIVPDGRVGLLAERTPGSAAGDSDAVSGEQPPSLGPSRWEELSVIGGKVAVFVEPGAELELRDVRLRGCDTGVVLPGTDPASDSRTIRCRGQSVRIEAKGDGISIADGARASLALIDGELRGGRRGVVLLPGDLGTRVQLQLHEVSFLDCAYGGLVAETDGGGLCAEDGWEVRRCRFVRCDQGIVLAPGATIPAVEVHDSEFLDNRRFGIEARGARNGAPLRVTSSRFRGNGIGLHSINLASALRVERCRFESNVGAGIFVGSFLSEVVNVHLRDCWILHNGASGVFAVSDGSNLVVRAEWCTISGNRTAGVERRERHAGEGRFSLAGCVVAGNTKDLEKIAADELRDCWIGAVDGAPGFRDPDRGDFSLDPEGPCAQRPLERSSESTDDPPGERRGRGASPGTSAQGS